MTQILEKSTASDAPVPQVSIGDLGFPKGVSALGGESLARVMPKGLSFFVTDGNPKARGLTDFMTGVGVALASIKLRRILEKSGAEIEFWPVDVYYENSHVSGYYLTVPLRRIRGVDMDASTIEIDELGLALSVDNLVLDDSRFVGIPFAVLAETMNLVVADELAKAIEGGGCTGCKFVRAASVRF